MSNMGLKCVNILIDSNHYILKIQYLIFPLLTKERLLKNKKGKCLIFIDDLEDKTAHIFKQM